MRELAQIMFAVGGGGWLIGTLLSKIAERYPEPRELPTAEQRFIMRDFATHGVYDPSRPVDWDGLDGALEETLTKLDKRQNAKGHPRVGDGL